MTEDVRGRLARLIDPFSQGAPSNEAGEAADRILTSGLVVPAAEIGRLTDALMVAENKRVAALAAAYIDDQTLRLHLGEMTAQEMRTARAVLRLVRARACHTACGRRTMSHFIGTATHPVTKRETPCVWLDDYFGRHRYGVRFDGEERVYPAEDLPRKDEDNA